MTLFNITWMSDWLTQAAQRRSPQTGSSCTSLYASWRSTASDTACVRKKGFWRSIVYTIDHQIFGRRIPFHHLNGYVAIIECFLETTCKNTILAMMHENKLRLIRLIIGSHTSYKGIRLCIKKLSNVLLTSCVSSPVFLVRVSDGTEDTSVLCFCSSSLT